MSLIRELTVALILGLALGKFKSAACWCSVETTLSEFQMRVTLVADSLGHLPATLNVNRTL